jgi:hypothetical protein
MSRAGIGARVGHRCNLHYVIDPAVFFTNARYMLNYTDRIYGSTGDSEKRKKRSEERASHNSHRAHTLVLWVAN